MYDHTPFGTPGEKELTNKIEVMAGQYMENEEFRQRIAASENNVVIYRFQTEIEEQMPHLVQVNIEKAANEFIDLCVVYDNTPFGTPGEKELTKKIEVMAGQYMENEEFRQRISSSENDVAIYRFQIEMEEQMPHLKDIQSSLTDNSLDNSLNSAWKKTPILQPPQGIETFYRLRRFCQPALKCRVFVQKVSI